jgi:peptidoglycan hydrolase-like protein with peptidoglycan-binding domain
LPPIVLIWLALLATPQPVFTTGAHGPAVQAVQQELTRLHDYSGALDGIYGPETAAAVTLFEQKSGLTQDGTAGPSVLGRIVADVAQSAPVLQEGAQGPAVSDLQGLLQADGVQVSVDGDFGPATQSAVQHLQSERGFATDGIVGTETWQALFARPYQVQQGNTLSQLSAMYGLPLQNLIAADGGSTNLQSGQELLLPYAGWNASSPPAAPTSQPSATAGSSSTSGSSGASGQSKGSSASSSNTNGSSPSSSFIPATDLAKWGAAGTPDLSVVVIAEDQTAARALERGGLPSGMLLALPPSLSSSDQTGTALVAASTAPKDVKTGVVWLGKADSPDLLALLARGVHVLMAPEVAPGKLLAQASGGATFLVPVHGSDLPSLTALSQQLTKAGYSLVRPSGF